MRAKMSRFEKENMVAMAALFVSAVILAATHRTRGDPSKVESEPVMNPAHVLEPVPEGQYLEGQWEDIYRQHGRFDESSDRSIGERLCLRWF